MFRAMALKELRETVWITVPVLVVCYLVFGGVLGSAFEAFGARMSILSFGYRYSQNWVPFVDDYASYDQLYWLCAAVAVGLGLRQTLGESISGTYPLLFHRPVCRNWLIGVKLGVGVSLYLICGSIPILAYGVFAATPGNHASPFEWSMTVPAWAAMLEMALFYFAAFLSGLRPGRWFGSRLLPLAAVVPLLINVFPEPFRTGWVVHLLAVMAVDVWMIAAIFYVSETRDYS
jgi:hypothetical protein